MTENDYIDALFHEILKADTRDRLVFLEDDIGIAVGLDVIQKKEDVRFLKLALQNRYQYILYSEILAEVSNLAEVGGCVEKFQDQMKEIQRSHLVLLEFNQ